MGSVRGSPGLAGGSLTSWGLEKLRRRRRARVGRHHRGAVVYGCFAVGGSVGGDRLSGGGGPLRRPLGDSSPFRGKRTGEENLHRLADPCYASDTREQREW